MAVMKAITNSSYVDLKDSASLLQGLVSEEAYLEERHIRVREQYHDYYSEDYHY